MCSNSRSASLSTPWAQCCCRVFFVITGLGVNIGGLSATDLVELAAIVVVACARESSSAPRCPLGIFGNAVAGGEHAWAAHEHARPHELIILNAGVGLGVLDTPMFTMMVIMALFTTALAGPLLPRHRAPLDRAGTAPDPDQEQWEVKSGPCCQPVARN